jgi:hypothetical protein
MNTIRNTKNITQNVKNTPNKTRTKTTTQIGEPASKFVPHWGHWTHFPTLFGGTDTEVLQVGHLNRVMGRAPGQWLGRLDPHYHQGRRPCKPKSGPDLSVVKPSALRYSWPAGEWTGQARAVGPGTPTRNPVPGDVDDVRSQWTGTAGGRTGTPVRGHHVGLPRRVTGNIISFSEQGNPNQTNERYLLGCIAMFAL